MSEPINEAGALLLWEKELAAGKRKPTTFDALWRAACLEARARDWMRDDLIDAANEDRLAAAQLVIEHYAEIAA